MINERQLMSRKEQIEIINLLSTISVNTNECIRKIAGYNDGDDIGHIGTEQMYLYIKNRMGIIQKLIPDILLKSMDF